jgi:hypothetical protein
MKTIIVDMKVKGLLGKATFKSVRGRVWEFYSWKMTEK